MRNQINAVAVCEALLFYGSCLFVFFVGVSLPALLTCLIIYTIQMLGMSTFYHRYFSHGTFKTSRPWQFLFAFIGTFSGQRGPLWWAAHHRTHHFYADTEKDIHSPTRSGFLYSWMGWFFYKKANEADYSLLKDFTSYPELRFLDRYWRLGPLLLIMITFSAGTFLNTHYPRLGANGWQLVVWGFVMATLLSQQVTFLINTLNHMVGSKPHSNEDNSRNNFIFGVLGMGEGWHNNHHAFPRSAKVGFHWWQLDLSYYFILLLEKIGIISDVKIARPVHRMETVPGITF